MNNRIISLSVCVSFLACILCAPIYAFVHEFANNGLLLCETNTAGFSKNISLSGNKLHGLEDFTENIKIKSNKNVDFSNNFALIPNPVSIASVSKTQNEGNMQKIFEKSSAFLFYAIERLRMCRSPGTIVLFTLFILSYIALLRAVYVNGIIRFAFKNLCLNKTGVFYFEVRP